MWSLDVIILLLFCYASLLTCDGRVYFVSKNFYNILHWDPVEPAFPGEKVLYSVRYWSDEDDQIVQIKKECQNISDRFCDLTGETPSVYDVHYRAQVFSNAILGPPILFTHTTVSSLHVNVTLPLGPNGNSVEDIIIKSKKGPEEVQIHYTLDIIKPKWAAQVNITTTGRFVINLKNNQTEYCGNVFYTPSTEGRLKSENATFCVTLPDDPLMLLPWLLVSAALLTTIIIVSVVYMCNYVKAGKEKSKLLASTFSPPHRVLPSPDRNIVISKPEIYVQSEPTVYSTVRVETNRPVAGPGGYSPQDVPWQDSDCSSVETSADSVTSKHENTGGQSSESYGVVAVHVPAAQNEDFQQATNDKRKTSNVQLSSSGERLRLTNYPWTRTGLKKEEEDMGEEEVSRPILLGGWGLQVQE
nr:interferon lambda receptor 1 [Pseudochaenichthys georgianus]